MMYDSLARVRDVDWGMMRVEQWPGWFMPLMLVAIVWSLFWKGLALWHAAGRKESAWFIILLIFNTLGILELIYLFGFAKIKSDKLFK